MNKAQLLKQIVASLGKSLSVLQKAAEASHAEATHESSKAENKYVGVDRTFGSLRKVGADAPTLGWWPQSLWDCPESGFGQAQPHCVNSLRPPGLLLLCALGVLCYSTVATASLPCIWCIPRFESPRAHLHRTSWRVLRGFCAWND